MAKTTLISASSSVTIKIKDNYYKVEYKEERELCEGDNVDFERQNLWDDVNTTVDTQAEDILRTFNRK